MSSALEKPMSLPDAPRPAQICAPRASVSVGRCRTWLPPAHPPAAPRGAGGGTDRRAARAMPMRLASCAPMQGRWASIPNEIGAPLQGRGGGGEPQDRADLPRAGAGARACRPGRLILLGVVLAVGAYAGWYRLSGEGTPAGRDHDAGTAAAGPAGGAGRATECPPPAALRSRCRAADRGARACKPMRPPTPADFAQLGRRRAGLRCRSRLNRRQAPARTNRAIAAARPMPTPGCRSATRPGRSC